MDGAREDNARGGWKSESKTGRGMFPGKRHFHDMCGQAMDTIRLWARLGFRLGSRRAGRCTGYRVEGALEDEARGGWMSKTGRGICPGKRHFHEMCGLGFRLGSRMAGTGVVGWRCS